MTAGSIIKTGFIFLCRLISFDSNSTNKTTIGKLKNQRESTVEENRFLRLMENFTEAIFDAVHEDIVWKNGSQCCECDVRFEKGTLKEEFCL